MLQLTQSERDGELTIALSGELDHHAARAAIEQAEDMLALFPSGRMTLELSGLTFMDSSGLAVAMHLHRSCKRMGAEFAVRGAPPQAMRVFEAAGLPRIMIFERGQKDARSHQ